MLPRQGHQPHSHGHGYGSLNSEALLCRGASLLGYDADDKRRADHQPEAEERQRAWAIHDFAPVSGATLFREDAPVTLTPVRPITHLGEIPGQALRRLPTVGEKQRAHSIGLGFIVSIILMGAAAASLYAGLARADAVYAEARV